LIRALRILAPATPTDARSASGNARLRSTAFKLGLFAVILEFLLSPNTLELLGIKYNSVGGNPLLKLHPATYMVSIACFMVLVMVRPAGSGLVRFLRNTPALATYTVLILFCAFYSIVNVGFSGAAVYVESYLSAALLAVALEAATDRQKRALAWWIIGFCLLSVVISIGETATQAHLIPSTYGDDVDANTKQLIDDTADFRGDGLFGHPLTAAFSASMATFLLLRMEMNGLLKAGLFTALLIGLLSFGGRAALAMTVIMITVAAGAQLIRGMAQRNLSLNFLGALTAGIIILPPLIIMVVAGTDIGERIITHMYFDDSASVRNTQWLVLYHLNLHDVLFGVPPTRLDVLKYQIGLGTATTDIENFWLLMFLNLGIIGFMVFLFALCLLLVHLGRRTNHPLGWMMLLAAILIDSTSNSLGRKSADLFFLTACIVAMTGYPKTAPVPHPVTRKQPVGRGRDVDHLSLRPSPEKLVGLKP